jgi:N-acetylglucosaminyl-diphospho-decaprenol L-rhamnosyltransferase
MRSDVTIVIVTFNSEASIGVCLASILGQGHGLSQQVIVVDNDSSDSTVAIVKSQFPDVKLIRPGTNLGFSRGVNLGASQSNSEFILLLNPDTVILRNAIVTIVGFARLNPRAGLYGGRTLKQDGTLEPSSCWGVPTLWSLAMFALGATAVFPRSRLLDPESLGGWQRDSNREVGVITGCFMLVHHEAWIKLGGLDERFFMYGEDVDFAMRARGLGYYPSICHEAELIHEVGKSSATPLHKMRLLFRGKAMLLRMHWGGGEMWLGLLLLQYGTGLRSALHRLRCVVRRDEHTDHWTALWRERGDWLQGYATNSGKVD